MSRAPPGRRATGLRTPEVREQLEQLRSGGWERSSREAETIAVIDTRPHAPRARTGCALPRADLAARRRALRRDRRARRPRARPHRRGRSRAAWASTDDAASRGGDDASERLGERADARPAVRYRAEDFTISRQRSWGTPIPIVYCEGCGTVPVPREQLPVLLPLDITPTGAGNPLAELEEFVNTTCPRVRRPGEARDRHAGLPLRRAVAVDPGVRAAGERARSRSRRSSRCATCATGCPPSGSWPALTAATSSSTSGS